MAKNSDDIANESVCALEACLKWYTGQGLDEASRLEILNIVKRQKPKLSAEYKDYAKRYAEQVKEQE